MAALLGLGLYFLPSLIAVARRTHNSTGIFMLNLFLGWTGIGWFIALMLSIFSASWYPYPPHWYYPPPRQW